MELRFLYIGSQDTERDLAVWLALPGARLRWRFRHFGADVAAVDVGTPPLVLLADHRPPGSVLPIYAVADLAVETSRLTGAGWTLEQGPLGTPEGSATVLRDPSSVSIALLQVDRPDALDGAYHDPDHEHAVRP
ncbi:MAG: Glyoxalase-like domain [Acidimicrobiales bacterium]|nr:Glyoxalase-like domain [Acidimicrobiales bacterium]